MFSDFQPSMPFIHRLIKLVLDLSELISLSQREGQRRRRAAKREAAA